MMHFAVAQTADIQEKTEVLKRASCMILIDDIVMMIFLEGGFCIPLGILDIRHTPVDQLLCSSKRLAEVTTILAFGTYFSLDGVQQFRLLFLLVFFNHEAQDMI